MRADDILDAWDQGLDPLKDRPVLGAAKTADDIIDEWDAENGGFFSGLKDMGVYALSAIPTAVQGVVDVGRMATGDADVLKNFSDWIGEQTDSFKDFALSDAALAQQRRLDRMMADPNYSIADLPTIIAANPRATVGSALESLGSMVTPTGMGVGAVRGVGAAARLAQAGRGGALARVLGNVSPTKAAAAGSMLGNAAINAADTYTSEALENQDQADRYLGAGISAGTSILASKLTGGGAENILAQLLTGNAARQIGQSAARRAVTGFIKGGGKEFGQEFIEEGGNIAGESVGSGTPIDWNNALKRQTFAGTLGAILGGPIGMTSGLAARPQQQIPQNVPQSEGPQQNPQAALDALGELFEQATQSQQSQQTPVPQPEVQPRVQTQEPVQPQSQQQTTQTQQVEANNVEPVSQQNTQQPNTQTPVVLQNRNRSNKASITQMERIAGNPDYGRVSFGRDFANGAPVVAYGSIPDNQKGRTDYATTAEGERIPVQYAVVEADSVATSHNVNGIANPEYGRQDRVTAIAGNGRIVGITSAYQQGTAANYRRELTEDAAMHGVNPEVINGMRNPVLVRIMPNERVTGNIGDISNTSGNNQLNAVEKAHNDANRVNFEGMEFNEDGSPTQESVVSFIRSMPSAEQAEMIDEHGRITTQAVDRLNNAIFAKAYGNDDVIAMYAQAVDPEAKLVINTLSAVAPKMARLDGCGELDFRGALIDAVNQIVQGKRKGLSMQDIAAQVDAFADPDVELFLRLFAQNPRSNKQVIEVLSDAADFAYNEATRDTETEDMFGGVQRASRADLMQHIQQTNNQITELRNAQRRARQRNQAPDLQNPEGSVSSGQNASGRNTGTNPSPNDSRGSSNAQGNEGFSLQGQTADEIEAEARAREEAEAQRAREDAQNQQRQEAQNLRNEVSSLNEGYADNFTLTDDSTSAEDALRGQGDLRFSRESELLAPNGQPSNLAPEQWRQVRTPEFKAWFGDWENDSESASKVLDENGEPRVVYHGTNNVQKTVRRNPRTGFDEYQYSNFESFENQYDEQPGHFFNSNRDNAGSYGSNIYDVYLNLKNPLIIDANNSSYNTIRYNGMVNDTYGWAQWAKDNGYDGVIFNNIRDGAGFTEMSEATNNYVAFRSNQIKSATDNNGEFNPNDRRLRFSRSTSFKPEAELVQGIKEYFGTTWDPRESGYMMQDGDMLNMSGTHEVEDERTKRDLRGRRTVDHREVSGTNVRGVSTEHFFEDQNIQDQSDYMYNFMARTGAMRMDYGSGIAALTRQPTRAQLQMLQRMAYENDGLIVSYYTPEGRIVDEAEWEGPVTQKRIKDFFAQAQQKADAGQAGAYASRTKNNQGGSTVESITETLSNDSDIGEAFRNLRSRGSVVVVQSEKDLLNATSNNTSKSYIHGYEGEDFTVDSPVSHAEEAWNTSGFIARLEGVDGVRGGNIYLTLGYARKEHAGRDITHAFDHAREYPFRAPEERSQYGLVDDLIKQTIDDLRDQTVNVYTQKGGEVILETPQRAYVLRWNDQYNGYVIITRTPSSDKNTKAKLSSGLWKDRGNASLSLVHEAYTANAPSSVSRRHQGRNGGIMAESRSVEFNDSSFIENGRGGVEIDGVVIKRSANGSIQGAYDPRTQKVYLVADNLTDENARAVFMHEVGVHMAADGDMKAVFARAKQIVWNGAANGDKVAQAAKRRMDAAGETSPEEAAAYLVEEAVKAQKDLPKSHPIVQWLEDLMRRVRLWINKKLGVNNLPGLRLTTDDIVAVARANAKSLGNVERKPSNGMTTFADDYRGEWRERRGDLRTKKDGARGSWARNMGLNSGWGSPIQRDELGRWKLAWGEHIATGIGNMALDAAEAMIPALRTKYAMRMAPKEVREMYRDLRAQVDNAKRKVGKVAEEMAKWSDNDRRLISDVIEKALDADAHPPEHVLKMASMMSDLMTQQGQDLVNLGMLSEEAFNRWRGQYLPRFYNRRKELDGEGWFKNFMKRGVPLRGVGGGSLKGRGKYELIEVKDLDKYIRDGWEVRDERYTFNKEAKESQPELAFKDMPNVEVDEHQTVNVWRDWTPKERQEMGEIRDAGYRFVMGYMQMQEDLALGRLFKQIAENPAWTRNTPSEGYSAVPDVVIPETGGVKRYGALAGKYVKDEVLAQVMPHAEVPSAFARAYRNLLSYWKEGKTALNPVSHMNNTAGNIIMAHLAGVNMWDAKAYLEIRKAFKENAAWLKEAEENGLFTGSFSKEEIAKLLPEEYTKLESKQESLGKRGFEFVFNYMLNYGLRKKMRNLYDAEDSFFKALIYKYAKDHGLSTKDAIDYALGFIPTYDDLPGGARAIRDSAIPFFAWTYKIVPRLALTMVTYPHRFLAPAALMWTANLLSYAIAAGDADDDWWTRIEKGQKLRETEEGLLPEYMQGMGAMFNPKFLRLWNDPTTNLPVYWNIGNFIPGGQMFDLTNQAGGIPRPEMLAVGTPLYTLWAAMGLNVDTFTGREITKDSDTVAEAAEKRATYMWRQLAPALAYGGYHFERVLNGLANATGESVMGYTGIGRNGQAVTPLNAAINTMGLKVRNVDFQKEFSFKISDIQRENREILANIRSLSRYIKQGSINPLEGQEEIKKQREKLRDNTARAKELQQLNRDRENLSNGE
ncbi:hypothetical protein [Parasutterella secunda]|uniref:Uncharacterized protein n=1 Tax=Parasutterella secunda TaxID=626947 RepID=A0ABS2GQY7_9BURK|nr:hypothetical protein [Parasutterella secunda]MBM6928193.1 hypothetical protein [Parasutterella secunda]